MEQRNEMLRNMRLTERQKRGDVQHLLSRSFSQRGFSGLLSPPADISIPVPQFPIPPIINEEVVPTSPKQGADEEMVSIGELSIEPRVAGSFATALNSPPQSQTTETDKIKGSTVLVQLEDFDTGATKVASLSADSAGPAFIESESGEESCSEEKAVRTPLLVTSAGNSGGLPRMNQPAIRSYDKMFEAEEEKLSGGGEAEGGASLGVPGGPTP